MTDYNDQCRNLWAATLLLAIEDLTSKKSKTRKAAIAWIKGQTSRNDYFTSCRNLCSIVDICYETLLKQSIRIYNSKVIKSPRKKGTEDALQVLLNLNTENMTMTEIMRATGTPGQETIRTRLKRLGKTYKNRRPLTPTKHIQAIFDNNDMSQLTAPQISERWGLNIITVRCKLSRDKIPHRVNPKDKGRPKHIPPVKEWWL